MRISCLLAIALVLFLALSGCQKSVSGAAEAGTVWTAQLSGQQVVPPVDVPATGQATLTLSEDGKELNYTIDVEQITDVVKAHLCLAPKGQNGEVIAELYPEKIAEEALRGPISGTLVQGMLDASQLMGPMKGETIDELVQKIKAGDVYVQIHTQEYPAGAIRGQFYQQ